MCYHGDLPRRQRRQIQEQFMSGEVDIVLATNAFGGRVDKEDIRSRYPRRDTRLDLNSLSGDRQSGS